MIAACPTCGARYRIDVAKLPQDGARLRCARCEAVFRVRPPSESAARPATPAPAAHTPAPARVPAPPAAVPVAPAPVLTPAPPAAEPEPAASRDRERLVLVADPGLPTGKALVGALTSWGFEALLVHDGVEAILTVQRSLPRVVVLDAALPKMFGFQVCELIKRNESLRSIHVVLVGAIHDQQRYRRPPGDLYGADAYVERHELPDALAPIFERFGMPPQGGPTPEPVPAQRRHVPPSAAAAHAAQSSSAPPAARPLAPPARPSVPQAPAAPVARMPSSDGLDEVRAQAERLARIIVSDIVLYNVEKFEAGVRSGDVIAALDDELEEGRALFAARIDPRVGTADEFLQRELLRVARGRGMAG